MELIKGFDNVDVLLILLFLDLLCLTVAGCGLATAPTDEPRTGCENHSVHIPPSSEQQTMLADMLLHD